MNNYEFVILIQIFLIFFTKLCILFSGGYDDDADEMSDQILMFNKETRKFEQIGKLEQRRYLHSMSLVNISNFMCIF